MVLSLNSNWIERLPDDVREATEASMRLREVDKGSTIYSYGEIGSALWQVRSGTVRISTYSADSKEVVFALFTDGDCFGEISLLDNKPAANTATAMTNCQLAELKRKDFDELYRQYPAFAKVLTEFLCERLRHMFSFYEEIATRPLEQRIAHRLCYINNLLQADSDHELAEPIAMTQQDLSNMLGASRQMVSKVLNHWRDEGIIGIEYGKLIIHDRSRLRDIAIS
jgi:CRP-like cAMP-binding protein